MRFKWYGTATLLFESGSTRLLFDPYCKKYADSAPVPLEEARTADAIFITHAHLDHFCDVDIFSEGVRPVYVSRTGIALAQKNRLADACMHPIAAGDEIHIGAFTVRAFPARHCRFDLLTVLRVLFSPRTWLHFHDAVSLLNHATKFRIRRNDVLAFEISDGQTNALIFGSADLVPHADYPRNSDLLVFPYQGRTRPQKKLARILQVTNPKCVAIDHFDDAFPPITYRVGTQKFAPTVKSVLPQATAILTQQNVWYDV